MLANRRRPSSAAADIREHGSAIRMGDTVGRRLMEIHGKRNGTSKTCRKSKSLALYFAPAVIPFSVTDHLPNADRSAHKPSKKARRPRGKPRPRNLRSCNTGGLALAPSSAHNRHKQMQLPRDFNIPAGSQFFGRASGIEAVPTSGMGIRT